MSKEAVESVVRFMLESGFPLWFVMIAMTWGMLIGGLWALDKWWFHRNRRRQNGTPQRVEVVGMESLQERVRSVEIAVGQHSMKSSEEHEEISVKVEGLADDHTKLRAALNPKESTA